MNRKEPSIGYQILAPIRDTMSDRPSSQKVFDKLLEQYRLEVLPAVMSQWGNIQGGGGGGGGELE